MSPERKLERKLVSYCKENGLYCRKFVSPGHRGVPDRIVVGPRGVLFIELKSPGQRPDLLQMRELALITGSGGQTLWTWDWNILKKQIDTLIPSSLL